VIYLVIKKIYLDGEDESVFLEAYISEKTNGFTRNAILVIPGGSYVTVCSSREGEPIAQAFIPYGYNAFVLHYSVARKKRFPAQLIESSKAIKNIKDNAIEYGIDPNRIFVVGFSAGGHLAGSLGTMWHKDYIYKEIDMPYGYNKPTGMMLIYPVINGVFEFSHRDSFNNLLCDNNPDYDSLKECSIDLNVSDKTVPTFLMHTSNDQIVSINNTLVMAEALSKIQNEFEVHIFPDAPHGVALGNQITECGVPKWNNKSISKWIDLAVKWAETV